MLENPSFRTRRLHRITRGSALVMAVAAAGTTWLTPRARADVAAADAVARVGMLDAALLAAMQTMEPAIDQTFDLPIVLTVSVGLGTRIEETGGDRHASCAQQAAITALA